jgi:glycerol uptake facilitator-like aquaporin
MYAHHTNSSAFSQKPHKMGQQSLHSVALQLLVKLDQSQRVAGSSSGVPSFNQEAKSLEFWRAVIGECLAAFFYVFIVCAAHLSWPGSPLVSPSAAPSSSFVMIALASGLSMATIAQCFGHISGAHVSPAITLALAATRRVSLFRALFYILAQCGGSIAGAALLYG